jgi:hypothetical protein
MRFRPVPRASRRMREKEIAEHLRAKIVFLASDRASYISGQALMWGAVVSCSDRSANGDLCENGQQEKCSKE